MDVRNSRNRVFSILNDNDCPSFHVRARETATASAESQRDQSPRQVRPNILRQAPYSKRNSSFSSVGSPPFLRHDSSSSKSSDGSMDSPSPVTPAYQYNETNFLPYDNLIPHPLNGYLPSPTSITPFMEQQLMISSNMPDPLQQIQQYPVKQQALPRSQYALIPATQAEIQQVVPPAPAPQPSLTSSSNTNSSGSNKSSPTNVNTTIGHNNTTGKKNKYPCPYASSHNCFATFTTSGHAARHGKKHTGEKGVHCPVCNKAFTRKDNMKQHERTHKDSISNASSAEPEAPPRKSKAAITRDAQMAKSKSFDTQSSAHSRKSSIIHSPLSEVASLAASHIDTPLTVEEPFLIENPLPPAIMMPCTTTEAPNQLQPQVHAQAQVQSISLYPPLDPSDTGMQVLSSGPTISDPNAATEIPRAAIEASKQAMLPQIHPPPALIRGFSDLDALAHVAAESYDPFYT